MNNQHPIDAAYFEIENTILRRNLTRIEVLWLLRILEYHLLNEALRSQEEPRDEFAFKGVA